MKLSDYAFNVIVFVIFYGLWIVLYEFSLIPFELCLIMEVGNGFAFIGNMLYDSDKEAVE